MYLTKEQSDLVRESYTLINERYPKYADTFYHRLLHQHPFTRALFPDDLRHQSEIFRQTLDTLIERVNDLEALTPGLAALARRHVGYGVATNHYAPVGEALIDTFEELLGERFTPATRHAWETLYEAVANVMCDEPSVEGSGRSDTMLMPGQRHRFPD